MAVENGVWTMYGMDWDDPYRIRSYREFLLQSFHSIFFITAAAARTVFIQKHGAKTAPLPLAVSFPHYRADQGLSPMQKACHWQPFCIRWY